MKQLENNLSNYHADKKLSVSVAYGLDHGSHLFAEKAILADYLGVSLGKNSGPSEKPMKAM